MTELEQYPWEKIREKLADTSSSDLESYLSELNAGELVRSLFPLSEQEQRSLLLRISPDAAAGIIEELPDAQAAELLDDMAALDAAHIVEGISSDTKADILSEMAESDAEAILEEMDEEIAADTRKLLEYEPETAGGLMQTEFIAYRQALTVQTVLEDMFTREEEYSQYGAQFIYVVQTKARLIGV